MMGEVTQFTEPDHRQLLSSVNVALLQTQETISRLSAAYHDKLKEIEESRRAILADEALLSGIRHSLDALRDTSERLSSERRSLMYACTVDEFRSVLVADVPTKLTKADAARCIEDAGRVRAVFNDRAPIPNGEDWSSEEHGFRRQVYLSDDIPKEAMLAILDEVSP